MKIDYNLFEVEVIIVISSVVSEIARYLCFHSHVLHIKCNLLYVFLSTPWLTQYLHSLGHKLWGKTLPKNDRNGNSNFLAYVAVILSREFDDLIVESLMQPDQRASQVVHLSLPSIADSLASPLPVTARTTVPSVLWAPIRVPQLPKSPKGTPQPANLRPDRQWQAHSCIADLQATCSAWNTCDSSACKVLYRT